MQRRLGFMGRISSSFLMSLIILPAIAGCQTVTAVDPATITGGEGFIVDGRTRRQEVLERLGEEQMSFENRAILIYHVHMTADGRIDLQRDARIPCDAYVLVFDSDGVLVRHSYIKHGCSH